MLNIETNSQRNTLYITLSGHFNIEETKAAGKEVLAAASKMKPGFNLITDIRKCHPSDSASLGELQRILEALSKKGLRLAVRITQIALSAIQFERVSKEVGYDSIATFSLEEAENIIATRLQDGDDGGQWKWERVRQYRRISVGPDHTVQFSLAGKAFSNIRITNLSAQGCFVVIENNWGNLFNEGAILDGFALEHNDLPPNQILAKIVRVIPRLTEISEDDLGLGVMFLTQTPAYMEWIDAFVSAYFDY